MDREMLEQWLLSIDSEREAECELGDWHREQKAAKQAHKVIAAMHDGIAIGLFRIQVPLQVLLETTAADLRKKRQELTPSGDMTYEQVAAIEEPNT